MRQNELRNVLISLLYTEYLDRGKEISFKARVIAKNIDSSSHAIGHICGELMEDGLLQRHGCQNASSWGTLFKTVEK